MIKSKNKKKKVKKTRNTYSNIFPINTRGKEFQLEDRQYLKEYILDHLKDDWIILRGDAEMISTIEKAIYTPGTDASGDFAMILGVKSSFYLAKKISALKDRITIWGDISKDVYDKLIMINLIATGICDIDHVVWECTTKNIGNEIDNGDGAGNEKVLNEFYDDFVEDILKYVLQM